MNSNDVTRIIDYLNNNVSDADKEAFEKELSENSSLQRLFNEIKLYWKSQPKVKYELDVEKALSRVNSKIDNSKNIRLGQIIRIAASVIIFIAILFGGNSVYENYFETKTIVLTNIKESKRKIVLADGTSVWLKNGASFEYLNRFSSDTREVKLTGEAYFEVAKNPKKPFIINTENSSIKVLGTSFNLKSTNKNVEIFVNSGKVKLSGKRNHTILTKGYSATLNKTKDKIERRKFKNNNYKSWLTGVLKFKNTPLKKVCEDLSKHFNKKISLKNRKLNNLEFTGEFNNASLEDIVSAVQFSTDADIIIK